MKIFVVLSILLSVNVFSFSGQYSGTVEIESSIDNYNNCSFDDLRIKATNNNLSINNAVVNCKNPQHIFFWEDLYLSRVGEILVNHLNHEVGEITDKTIRIVIPILDPHTGELHDTETIFKKISKNKILLEHDSSTTYIKFKVKSELILK